MSGFKDYFSNVAQDYARHRPLYPASLYEWLAAESSAHALAWDCATGNGQAAHGLAEHFQGVIATDASEQQIAAAPPHPKIVFKVASAESSGLPDASIDLICVAQAAHWFDMPAFNLEAARVARPGALVALIAYKLCQTVPEVDRLIAEAYYGELERHWAPERALIDEGYASLAFPFPPVAAPAMEMRAHWSADQLLGYLNTWSGIRALNQAEGRDLVAEWAPQIRAAWGDGQRPVVWPLTVKAGRAL